MRPAGLIHVGTLDVDDVASPFEAISHGGGRRRRRFDRRIPWTAAPAGKARRSGSLARPGRVFGSDQLLDRLELEQMQSVAGEGQAPGLPASVLDVVGLEDEVHAALVYQKADRSKMCLAMS